MEQSRKNLKLFSIIILILAALSMVQVVCALLFGALNDATIPEDAPENILLITKILIFSFALLLTAPSIYVGIKGMRVAKNPDRSKGHIIWAILLLVLACASLSVPISAFVKSGFQYANVSSFLSIAVDIFFFLDYIKYAMAVRNAVA